MQKDLSQDLKPQDILKSIESMIRETSAVLKLLAHSTQNIQLLSNHFETIKNLINSVRLSSYSDDVRKRVNILIPLEVLMRETKKEQWTSKELFIESQALPPLSLFGPKNDSFFM